MNFLPFSYNWLVKKNLNILNINTILDVGCGEGNFGVRFNKEKKYTLTGIDIFTPYLKKSFDTGTYNKIIKADINKGLKFPDKQFDGVVCLETIEHLRKSNGINLLNQMEKVAKKIILISCPMGIARQDAYDNNKHQAHLSFWFPKELRERGFKVYGVGLKMVFGNQTHVNYRLTPLLLPLAFLSFLFNPIANFLPEISCQMVAVKILRSKA